MQYYQCKYPIEFVLSENIDKHFDSHNHVGHYVISVVMLGTVAVYLENREMVCHRGDVFIIPPYGGIILYSFSKFKVLCFLIPVSFFAL